MLSEFDRRLDELQSSSSDAPAHEVDALVVVYERLMSAAAICWTYCGRKPEDALVIAVLQELSRAAESEKKQ